jgi:glutathione S-transferase
VRPLFATLDWLEDRLATNRYLFGDRLTEVDWRLFTVPAAAPGLPEWIRPQPTEYVDEPPEGAGWLHEIKFDG